MKKAIIVFIFALLAVMFFFFSCRFGGEQREIVVLINSTAAQIRFLESEVLEGFERLHRVRVVLRNYSSNEELLYILSDTYQSKISLVSVPFALTSQLVESKKVIAFDEIMPQSTIDFDAEVYHKAFLNVGRINERFYYFPHKVEVPVMFHIKSKVADARSRFPEYRTRINRALRAVNGFGLPRNYVLEENPNYWDLFDIFSIGYVLANTEFAGKRAGRILMRDIFSTARGGNLFNDYAKALGASSRDLENNVGRAVSEMQKWRQLFLDNNILHERSFLAQSILNSQDYNAIRQGEIFIAYFLQQNCFNVLEGTVESQMRPHVSDLSDVGISVIPAATSVTLDNLGQAIKSSRRVSTISGFSWGIPRNAPDKRLAYLLIQFLNHRFHSTVASVRFGAIPVREDIIINLQNIYDTRWLSEGYAQVLKELIASFDAERKNK